MGGTFRQKHHKRFSGPMCCLMAFQRDQKPFGKSFYQAQRQFLSFEPKLMKDDTLHKYYSDSCCPFVAIDKL